MASAYKIRRLHYDQGMQTEKQDEKAQLIEYLQGIYSELYPYCARYTDTYHLSPCR